MIYLGYCAFELLQQLLFYLSFSLLLSLSFLLYGANFVWIFLFFRSRFCFLQHAAIVQLASLHFLLSLPRLTPSWPLRHWQCAFTSYRNFFAGIRYSWVSACGQNGSGCGLKRSECMQRVCVCVYVCVGCVRVYVIECK